MTGLIPYTVWPVITCKALKCPAAVHLQSFTETRRSIKTSTACTPLRSDPRAGVPTKHATYQIVLPIIKIRNKSSEHRTTTAAQSSVEYQIMQMLVSHSFKRILLPLYVRLLKYLSDLIMLSAANKSLACVLSHTLTGNVLRKSYFLSKSYVY